MWNFKDGPYFDLYVSYMYQRSSVLTLKTLPMEVWMMVITVLELKRSTLVTRDLNWWVSPRGSVSLMDSGQEKHQFANVSYYLEGTSLIVVRHNERALNSVHRQWLHCKKYLVVLT